MNSQFLIGNSDGIRRWEVIENQESHVSDALNERLVKYAVRESVREIRDFFNVTVPEGCVDDTVQQYFKNINTANSIGLIIPGGIDEADFLNFLVIGKILKPEFYCESGVFVGSSLFAFISASPSTPVLAIDPDLQKLRLPKELLQNVKLESNFDFEELELEGANGLPFFTTISIPPQG